MRRSIDLAGQLPPSGLPRIAVITSLVLGGVVAVGLTVLIVVFVVTALAR